MSYVDLNPVRAALCERLEESDHTSAKQRLAQSDSTPVRAAEALSPISGIRGLGVLAMTQGEYLGLLDWTGRQLRPDKRGTISGAPPAILARHGHDAQRWPRQVLAVGSDFHRAVGSVESLLDKAKAMGQRWLQGIGIARAWADSAR